MESYKICVVLKIIYYFCYTFKIIEMMLSHLQGDHVLVLVKSITLLWASLVEPLKFNPSKAISNLNTSIVRSEEKVVATLTLKT